MEPIQGTHVKGEAAVPLDWTRKVASNSFDIGSCVAWIEDNRFYITAQHKVSMHVSLDVIDVVLVNPTRDCGHIPRLAHQVAFHGDTEIDRPEGAVRIAKRGPEQRFSLQSQMDGTESWGCAGDPAPKVQGAIFGPLIARCLVVGAAEDLTLPHPSPSAWVGRRITSSD